MTSNVLSRFLPPNGSPSVYETIRQHDADSDNSDVEERAGLVFDEDDPQEDFSDRELEDALADAERDELSSPSASKPFLRHQSPRRMPDEDRLKLGSHRRKPKRPRWVDTTSPRHDPDDGDDDVPASLLVEGGQDDEDLKSRLPPPPSSHIFADQEPTLRGPSSRGDRARWESAREQLPIHSDPRRPRPGAIWDHPNLATVDPKVKAMWRWANVENLDNFLKDVYTYFLGNGIWSILLNRVLSLLYVPLVFRYCKIPH